MESTDQDVTGTDKMVIVLVYNEQMHFIVFLDERICW